MFDVETLWADFARPIVSAEDYIDQPTLVARHRASICLLQLDAARDASHEGLCVLRQSLEDAHQIAHRFVDLGNIGLDVARHGDEDLKTAGDIFECHRLELGPHRLATVDRGSARDRNR